MASQKLECNSVLGTSSCTIAAHPHGGGGRGSEGGALVLRFLWKNYLSAGPPFGDMKRDACRGETDTEHCLRHRLFSNATADDILVVGSIIADKRYLDGITGWSSKSIRSLAQTYQSASDLLTEPARTEAAKMVLRAFPGTIVWHSFAWVVSMRLTKSWNRPLTSTFPFS